MRDDAGRWKTRAWGLSVAVLGILAVGPACQQTFDTLLQPVADNVLSKIDRFGVDPGPPVYTAKAFVNFESPHVSPLALSPDGQRLFAVNTPMARVEVFDVGDGGLTRVGAIPVGLDPVTVRARTNNEIWVANYVSSTVSIVDVQRGAVAHTLQTEAEPADIAFAAGRAFVVSRQRNLVQVFSLSDLAGPALTVPLAGLHPRAAALSPDGRTLYVAIFESGNATTILKTDAVSDPSGPYGGENPPPNSAGVFRPGMNEDLRTPPAVGLIVRRNPQTGAWLDDAGADWSRMVTWNVHDHDIAIIDTQSLAVSYVSGLMNLNMALAVRPDGALSVVGTEAFNEIQFEPNVTAKFVRTRLALVDPAGANAPRLVEMNAHLQAAYDAGVTTLPPEQRALSLADPRAVVWTTDGAQGYVAGMGSANVAVIDTNGNRLATFDVGNGPTGLALDEARARLYVLNRFDASLSIVDTQSLATLQTIVMADPTPADVRLGRRLLYDARLTSGLGVTACASCHVDARIDQIAWELGSPSDPMKTFDQICKDIAGGMVPNPPHCEDFHPMKGPMMTQTLQGIIGTEPFHWRGDRTGLADFNKAFVTLLGNDRQLSDEEMAALGSFLATVEYPPNPNRNRDNSLKTDLNGANAERGQDIYLHQPIDTAFGRIHRIEPIIRNFVEKQGPILACNACHQLPTGTDRQIITAVDGTLSQSFKVPQIRNVYEKIAFDRTSAENAKGFGFAHDGSAASLTDFFAEPVFDFGDGVSGADNVRDVIAFVNSMGTDTHAGVGMQVTLDAASANAPAAIADTDFMLRLADQGEVGVVVRGLFGGVPRGFAYHGGGIFQGDGPGGNVTTEQLRAASTAGDPLTWMIVPLGSEDRLGLAGE